MHHRFPFCRTIHFLTGAVVFATGCSGIPAADSPSEHGFNYVCAGRPKGDSTCDEIPGVAVTNREVPLPDRLAVGSVVRVEYWSRTKPGSSAVPIKVFSDSRDKLAPEAAV